jgi:APA family basic amino acid/polyamine antiporter
VIGNMVGAGVFLLPAALASYGSISLVGWVLSAIGALFVAKVFSNVSKLLPQVDGGPYAYTRRGFGDFAGFLVAWGYWISVWTANAALAVSLVSALSTFIPSLATNSLFAIFTGLSAIWLLTWVNTMGIKASGTVQLFTTILKLLPLVAVAIAGIFFVRWDYYIPFNRSGGSFMQAVGATASLTLFAFLGVECATIPAGSIANPEKTIPRATMLGTIITLLICILAMMSVMGLVPARDLQSSVTPFADAAAKIWGDHARYWVAAGVAMAAFGGLNGWILIQGQIPYAIAKDKLFPAVFAKENKKGVPYLAIVVGSLLVSIVMIMNFTRGLVEQFRFMILLATLTTVIPYLLVSAAYVIMVIESQGPMTKKEWIRVIALSSLAFLFSLLAIIGVGQEAVYWGLVLMLTGTPFYVWNVWKRRSRQVV